MQMLIVFLTILSELLEENLLKSQEMSGADNVFWSRGCTHPVVRWESVQGGTNNVEFIFKKLELRLGECDWASYLNDFSFNSHNYME